MDAKNLSKALMKCKDDIIKEVNNNLPRKIGVMAVNHFRDNFRRGGFVNGGLQPWQKTRRQIDDGSPYSPLTSRRNHLMSSTTSVPGIGMVTIRNDVPYAVIHNDGGTIDTHPTVTPRLRKFAWYKFYSLSANRSEDDPQASMWKAIALTKNRTLHVHGTMPQRQFIGESTELTAKFDELIRKAILALLNAD